MVNIKKAIIIIILVLVAVSMGCNERDNFINRTEEVMKIEKIDIKNNRFIQAIDIKNNTAVKIDTSKDIINTVDVGDYVRVSRSEYIKNNKAKYYYKIVKEKYNEARDYELINAKETKENTITAEIVDKNEKDDFAYYMGEGITTNKTYIIYYKEAGQDYYVKEIVKKDMFDLLSKGDKVVCKKMTYILQDNRIVHRYTLIKKVDKEITHGNIFK